MSEYNIQMNKYNALSAEYDQLYPKPMKHANTHAKDGSDPITPANIGAYTKTETDALLANKMSNDLGQASANLLEWASAQTFGGSFIINPTVTTTGVPVVTWYAGLLEVNSAGRKMTITRSSGGAPITYVNVTAASVWQGWQQLATATDLDTKVSKSGDTMTGDLNTGLSDGIHGKIGSFYSSNDNNNCQFMDTYNPANNSGIRLQVWANKNDPNITAGAGLWIYLNGAFNHLGNILHTGNAQAFGFTKIATGSYVGTGAVGREHPTVLTFNFAPKFLILVGHEGALPDGTTLLSKVGAYSIYGYNGFYHFYTYSSGWACTLSGWGTNTLSYYASGIDATYQFNVSGKTYFYMALG